MNAELSATNGCRSLVPIVWRDGYMRGRWELSRRGNKALFVRTRACAWWWTSLVPWEDRPSVVAALVAINARMGPTGAETTGKRLLLR
jgi:hypothetical protein